MALSVDGKVRILNGATATGAGASTRMIGAGRCVVSAFGTTSAGSGAATVAIQVSNDNASWVTAGTISITLGTTQTSDGFAINAPWLFVRANVASISGTDANVSVVISA